MDAATQPGLTLGHSTFIPNEDAGHSGSGKAFLFGLLVGALVALLWTPKTGEEAREQVAEWFVLLRERLVGLMTGVDDRPEMAPPETF